MSEKRTSLRAALASVLFTVTPVFGQVVFEDDFEVYDVENPSSLAVGGIPTGGWTPSSTALNASRIFDTANFGATRLWISLIDGTSLVSRGIEVDAESDYRFSVALVSETFDGGRRLNATYDILIGPDPATATSLIGGPQAVVTRGDDWSLPDSKEDHRFTKEFSTGSLDRDERLFLRLTRVSVAAGSSAWFGVDDVLLQKRQRVEVLPSGTTARVGEAGRTETLEVFVRGAPAAPVELVATADDQLLVNGGGRVSLAFTPPIDPDEPQLLVVSAVDDERDEGLHEGRIAFTVRSPDVNWDGFTVPALALRIEDDDWPVRFGADVLLGGQEGYPVYRIPGLAVAPDGSILAFAEARPDSADPGAAGRPIDLVLKRSTDGGRTWGQLIVLENDDDFDYSDPTPISFSTSPRENGGPRSSSLESGGVHLLYTRWPDDAGLFGVPPGLGAESSNHFLRTSRDGGVTWTPAVDITAQIKRPQWRGLVLGPGSGVRLRWQSDPARNGRLVAPAHIEATDNLVVVSDDLGASWTHLSLAQPMTGGSNANENEVVELVDGDLLMNARQTSGNRRRLFRSEDGGASWVEAYSPDFPVTTVDGSMIRHSARRIGDDRDRILFSAPLGEPAGSGAGRRNIGVRTSYDEGRSFINPVQLEGGFGAYSVLARLPDGTVGLLFETGTGLDLRFLDFEVQQLENGPHAAALTHYDGFGNRVERRGGGVGWSGQWSGDGLFTGGPFAATVRSASVPFAGLGLTAHEGRLELEGGGTVERTLARPVDLGADETTWVSLLIHRRSGDFPVGNSSGNDEALSIELQDATGLALAAFGVDSEERLALGPPAPSNTSPPGTVEPGVSYLLLARIDARVTRDDELRLGAVASGVDRPRHEELEGFWAVTGSLGNGSGLAERIVFASEPGATWALDEVRIATTRSELSNGFAAVLGEEERGRATRSGAPKGRRGASER